MARIDTVVEDLLGPDLPIAIRAFDGSRTGAAAAPATLVIRSPAALQRIIAAPGELGIGRAYVSGDLDVDGDLLATLLALRARLPGVHLRPRQLVRLARVVGVRGLRPPPPLPEEVRLRGRLHSRERDAAAIAHHYDVSNAFYRMILGASMTYSCALWTSADITLEEAQEAKYELICRKLGLREGMRLLDVGCGWGGMAIHAASRHEVSVVGITISAEQAEWAGKAVAHAGLADRIDIRLQDYRDVGDGPFGAISSIGMFEHVGVSQLGVYFDRLHSLLGPGGRLLNHGIGRPPGPRERRRRRQRTFVDSFVFPDGELHEVGTVVSAIQHAGFEVRHLESLREHYALTLRRWVRNLEDNWDAAVAEAGAARARIWRLYMAASALNFEAGRTQVHQVLAVRSDGGRSGMPLRPDFG